MRKRWKRKSGYKSPQPTIPIKETVKNNFFLTPIYNDWEDWRDGMRDLPRFDKSTFRREWKLKKSVKRKINPTYESYYWQENNPFYCVKRPDNRKYSKLKDKFEASLAQYL